jgi:hypothetical protein
MNNYETDSLEYRLGAVSRCFAIAVLALLLAADLAASHLMAADAASTSDHTYDFGGGNTLRIMNSYDSSTGTSASGTVQTWGNGTVFSSGSSHRADGTHSSNSDNTYNFGSGNNSGQQIATTRQPAPARLTQPKRGETGIQPEASPAPMPLETTTIWM